MAAMCDRLVLVVLILGTSCLSQVQAGCSKADRELIEDMFNMHSTDCVIDGDEIPNPRMKLGTSRQKRKVTTIEDGKWSDTNIRFCIDTAFSVDHQQVIRHAVEVMDQQTCLSFDESSSDMCQLMFEKDPSCLTIVGQSDATPHIIYLNAECSGIIGEVLHQMLHALGMWHEHQRPDRDTYVTILEENLREGEHIFYTRMDDFLDTLGFPYDYTSVMHHRSTQFAKDSGDDVLHTMLPVSDEELTEWYRRTMGQRAEMSFFDIYQINLFYCEDICSESGTECLNGGFPDPHNCDVCKCPDGFGGDLCEVKGPFDEESGCGGFATVTAEPDSIKFPGYDDVSQAYKDNSTCTWHLQAAEGEQFRMTFEGPFGVYCRGPEQVCYHWVEIRYKADLRLPGIRFCCQERPTVELISETNEAIVIFKSLWDAGIYEREGFQLAFQTVTDDRCEGISCENDGTCDGGVCICAEGYTGITCADAIDQGPCSENPCENGGLCVADGSDAYSCDCPDGYEGDDCEIHGCGSCEMPARTYNGQVTSGSQWPCEGLTRTKVLKCVTKEVTRRRWRWRRRRRTSIVKECKIVEEVAVGKFCGCGWELYESWSGGTKCAMTGWGEWDDECQCHGGECQLSRHRYDVSTWGMHYGCWSGSAYYESETERVDCPSDMSCEEDCEDHHSGWWW